MRKLFFFCFCFLLLSATAGFGQTASLKGSVTDTVEKRNISNSVIALLGKSDSVLVKFVRTDKDGNFLLKNLPPGAFILQVSHPDFADYVDEVSLTNSEIKLGPVFLTPKSKILEEVIVKQNVAIRIKGDTIEYKADSFKVSEGATVKDLLKKLPGLQVDKNGQITAQGQKVEKVLVDGEEFFSDDPAIVIENLRADAIDKVQSYDKKSDQSEFTGVDDGSKSKTLNLVLKDDKKKGYLGKVVVGGGTSDRYSEQALLNYFKGKKKISVYGIASNTGQTGLGWEDRGKFGEGMGFDDAEVEMGAGFISINSQGDDDFSDWSNQYYDEGIPSTLKGGVHFSNKWNADKHHINSNYSIKNMKTDAQGNSLTKYILKDSAYYSKEDHHSFLNQTTQLLDGTYDLKLDSASSIKIKVNGKLESKKGNTVTNAESDDEELNPVTKNHRTNTSNSDAKTFLASILWRQKLKKKGRTLSLSASQKYSDKESDGYLYSETYQFDHSPLPYLSDTVDQYKTSFTKTLTTNSKLVYTEPAGKKGLWEINYVFSRVSNSADRKSFDKVNSKYESLNQLYSNQYELNYLSNSAGLKYQYNGKKFTANIGTNLGIANYSQRDSSGKEVIHYRYTNLFPAARINYNFSSQKGLRLNYSGSPQPPSIDQIQPILENTNSLFIVVGNPLLKQAFRHNISVMYNNYKVLTGQSVWIYGGFYPTQKAIVTNQVTNNGITTQKYINTKGNYNYNFDGSYGFKLKKTEINLNFGLNTSGARYVNFVDNLKNTSRNASYGIRIYAGKYKEDKYDFGISSGMNYNHSISSISIEKNNFWSQEHNANVNVYITKKFQVGSDLNVYARQKIDAFDKNNNLAVWDASVSYKIFKKKNGVFKLEMKDILKQRRGYDRQFESNKLYERNYNMLGRYGLLSFTWNFTKNPATK